MTDTIIFDMDGVIIDSEPVHLMLEKEIFSELDIPVSDEEHHTFVGTSEKNMFQAIRKRFNIGITVDEMLAIKHAKYVDCLLNKDLVRLNEGVSDLIKDLHAKGYTLAIASSSEKKMIDLVVDRFGLRKFFSAIVSGAELPHSKPHPDIFLKTALLLNKKPSMCLVIEDSENGVIAAKNAGMKCIAYHSGQDTNQNLKQADRIITSFRDFDRDADLRR